jgi:hypothetical protein
MRSLALVAVVALAACPPAEEEEENLSAEACEHSVEGPFVGVTATADTAGAPDVTADHTRHDVTLIAVDGGNGGFVKYEAAAAAVYRVFLTKDVPLAAQDSAGNPLTFVEPVDETLCPEVVQSHHIQLGVGTAFIEIGPTTESEVGFVIEPDDDEAH